MTPTSRSPRRERPTGMSRREVTFISGTDTCAAWLYEAEGPDAGGGSPGIGRGPGPAGDRDGPRADRDAAGPAGSVRRALLASRHRRRGLRPAGLRLQDRGAGPRRPRDAARGLARGDRVRDRGGRAPARW